MNPQGLVPSPSARAHGNAGYFIRRAAEPRFAELNRGRPACPVDAKGNLYHPPETRLNNVIQPGWTAKTPGSSPPVAGDGRGGREPG